MGRPTVARLDHNHAATVHWLVRGNRAAPSPRWRGRAGRCHPGTLRTGGGAMNAIQQGTRVGLCLCLSAATLTGFPQNDACGGPLSGRPIVDSAFSADATTTVQQTLENGTRIERRATARYYRDRAGHVRVEQMLPGVDAQDPAGPRERITILPDTAS